MESVIMDKVIRRIFKTTNKDGKNYGYEITKFVVIDSPKAPVLSLEPLKDGTYRLCVNSAFNIADVESIDILRINSEDVIKVEGM
jgi:hypothetical protein